MTQKPRRVDLSPDNFIAGVSGLMSAEELGVYWLMCLLYYSHGGEFDYDEKRFVSMLPGTHWRSFRAAFEKLQDLGKVSSGSGHVSVKGCAGPLQDALKRIARAAENGSKGGRPINNNKALHKPNGLVDEKLARVAPSPPPSPPKDTPSLRSGVAQQSKRKSRSSLPENFPDEVSRKWAETHWLGKGRADLCGLMDDEAAKFRDHHTSHDTRSADWPASWRTWCSNAMNFSKVARNGKSKNTALDTFLQAGASIIDDLDERRAGERPNGNGASDEVIRPLLQARLHGGAGEVVD